MLEPNVVETECRRDWREPVDTIRKADYVPTDTSCIS